MGKPTKTNKKTAILHYERNESACVLSIPYFESILRKRGCQHDDSLGAMQLIRSIAQESRLEGQIQAIHKNKGNVRLNLTKDTLGIDKVDVVAGAELLLHQGAAQCI